MHTYTAVCVWIVERNSAVIHSILLPVARRHSTLPFGCEQERVCLRQCEWLFSKLLLPYNTRQAFSFSRSVLLFVCVPFPFSLLRFVFRVRRYWWVLDTVCMYVYVECVCSLGVSLFVWAAEFRIRFDFLFLYSISSSSHRSPQPGFNRDPFCVLCVYKLINVVSLFLWYSFVVTLLSYTHTHTRRHKHTQTHTHEIAQLADLTVVCKRKIKKKREKTVESNNKNVRRKERKRRRREKRNKI